MNGKKATPTPAVAAASAAGIDFLLHSYTPDPSAASYGSEAATALGRDSRCVFKTLMILADGVMVAAVVPVSGQLDLKALAASLGAKRAAMAAPAAAQRRTGYVWAASPRSVSGTAAPWWSTNRPWDSPPF